MNSSSRSIDSILDDLAAGDTVGVELFSAWEGHRTKQAVSALTRGRSQPEESEPIIDSAGENAPCGVRVRHDVHGEASVFPVAQPDDLLAQGLMRAAGASANVAVTTAYDRCTTGALLTLAATGDALTHPGDDGEAPRRVDVLDKLGRDFKVEEDGSSLRLTRHDQQFYAAGAVFGIVLLLLIIFTFPFSVGILFVMKPKELFDRTIGAFRRQDSKVEISFSGGQMSGRTVVRGKVENEVTLDLREIHGAFALRNTHALTSAGPTLLMSGRLRPMPQFSGEGGSRALAQLTVLEATRSRHETP